MPTCLRLAALVVAAAVAPLAACSVPVFRYALERWPADAYVLQVTLPGAPDAAQTALLSGFSERARTLGLNCEVELAKEAGPAAWKLIYPHGNGPTPLGGAVDAAALKPLAESPLRQAVVNDLIAGESAVWVLIQGGDAAKDAAAEKLLRERAANLMQVAQLPEQKPAEDDPRGQGLGGPELRLSFTVRTVRRDDPAERVFVQLALGLDADAAKASAAGEPLATAIFGQGRMLPPVYGKDLSAATLDDVGLFLIGACSCQVKEQNPGVDLLLSCQWADRLYDAAQAAEARRAAAASATAPAVAATAPAAP